MKKLVILFTAMVVLLTISCKREPELYLYDAADADFKLPIIDLQLDVYWDYTLIYGIDYDWKAEWYYGWDDIDRQIFGELGYEMPSVFNIRRYYTNSQPYAPHDQVSSDKINGTTFHGRYQWGFWDILVWNDINTIDGVQSLIFDEQTSLDYVTAYTNQTMRSTRYSAPLFTRSFWAPEPLFAAYDQAIEINPNLDGFEYDAVRGVYVKKLNMELRPLTYIYLTQVILHHNNGRIRVRMSISSAADCSPSASADSGPTPSAVPTRLRTPTVTTWTSPSSSTTVWTPRWSSTLPIKCASTTREASLLWSSTSTPSRYPNALEAPASTQWSRI